MCVCKNMSGWMTCEGKEIEWLGLVQRSPGADVDVQPYAFTTKSLFVGHMDYRYLRWQVIDTPGILDRPLEERNTIEMQACRSALYPHSLTVQRTQDLTWHPWIVAISRPCSSTISICFLQQRVEWEADSPQNCCEYSTLGCLLAYAYVSGPGG